MSQTFSTRLSRGPSAVLDDSLPLPMKAVALVAGTALLALSSYVRVPMVPVPVTMQTLAVTLIGALFGWRLGAMTVLAWLGDALVGLPVLAGGASGVAPFLGATGGYLLAFPLVAAMTGCLAGRGWNGAHAGLAFAAMLLGNLLCLALGAAWLSHFTGAAQAVTLGVTPFLLGGLLKSALGAALLKAWQGRRAA